MYPYRSFHAPWRVVLLAAVVLAVGIPAASAAVPAPLLERPYVVLTDKPSAQAQTVANDHGRRFGVGVTRLFDRLGGYAGSMTERAAKELAKEPGVLVARDTVLSGFEEGAFRDLKSLPQPYTMLPSAWGWGLDRIDQRDKLATPPERKYSYSRTGAGVTAYVIDTGVRTGHGQFGDRATVGFDALKGNGQDCNGHGTHVAGILGGKDFGVAPDVKIVAVRVLDCKASGTVSNVIAGINYVVAQYRLKNPVGTTGNAIKPVVANLSLGGSTNTTIDKAVSDAIKAGVIFTVAAGNGGLLGNGKDACSVSPARVPEAITVGATDSADKRPTWSNYGKCVDVFAPGANIVSSWYKSPTAPSPGQTQEQADNTSYSQISGTSMSAPAVAGVAALLLEAVHGASPAQVSRAISGVGTTGKITGTNITGAKLLFAPSTSTDVASAVDLLNTTVPGPVPAPVPPPTCLLCGLLG